jgi:alpha-N-arabinofuranosidase
MRRVDPGIKLVASGSSDYGADWIEWNRTVLEMLRDHIDYIGIHTYINNRADDFEQFMAWSQRIDHYIEITAGLINEVRSGRPNARPIHIAYDEWNVWYRTGERDDLEEVYNFEDALAVGMFFNSFFRHADVVKMANLAQMVNVIAPIMTNEEGYFLQPTYFPLVEFGRQRGNMSLDVWVEGPSYSLRNRPPLGYLDVSSTYDEETGVVHVNVLNRSESRDIPTRIEIQEGSPEANIGIWEMNHPDLKATHTFGDDERVRPARDTLSVEVVDDGFVYTFPAHSLTVLSLQVRR